MEGKKQIAYIANARIIGILLVVFGHSYPFEAVIPPILDKMRSFIYCFHMPLFVFISGYLVSKTRSIERHGKKRYIQNRAVRLFVPYLVLTLLGFLPKILMQNFINDEVEMSFTYLIKTIFVPRWNVWGHFWFLPMIFFMALVSIIYLQVYRNSKYIALMILTLSFLAMLAPDETLWFGLSDIQDNLFWYLASLVLGLETNFEKMLKNMRFSFVFLLMAFAAFLKIESQIGNTIVASCMLLFVLSIAGKVNLQSSRLLVFIGKNSFGIFILSWPIQAVVEVVFNRILGFQVLLVMILMFVCGVMGSVIFTIIVEKLDKKVNMYYIKLIFGL